MADLLSELFEECFHGGFVRHFHGVAGDEELIGDVSEGELDKGFVLAGAEEDADGWLVAGCHFVLFVVGDVGIELAEVFVAEGLGFQFNEDVALEHAVVKHEIDEEVFASNEDAFLPGFEAEAVTHFQEKLLKAIKQRVFEVGLAHGLLGAEAEELEDVGIADDLSGSQCVGRSLGKNYSLQ